MSHKVKLAALAFLLSASVWAADTKYAVSNIPAELKANVDAVVREDKMVFTILARNKALYEVSYAVTIFKEDANERALLFVPYDKLSKVKEIEATVYDQDGKVFKKLKNSEIRDQSYTADALYADDRFKIADLTQAIYPYTVEYTYVIELNYLYSIPGTNVAGLDHTSEHVQYQLIFPPDLKPRYHTVNLDNAKPVESRVGDKMSYTWEFKNVKKLITEKNGPRLSEIRPRILAAPGEFEYDGYAGSMDSWKSMGLWYNKLNTGRDQLSPEAKAKVSSIIAGAKTDEEKARKLYAYLQSKSRYVSIQLGIGGLQPFPASDVEQKGYGDCKALSNYMVTLLKEAGVKSYMALIYGGDDNRPMITSFPSHQGNHVIVAVPMQKDTLWLECTSMTNTFGYLSDFTSDRYAVLLTPEGGKLAHTPVYTAEQNRQTRTAQLNIEANGNATAEVATTYAALQYDQINRFILSGPEEQRKFLQNRIDIPSFEVKSYSVKKLEEKLPAARLKVQLALPRYASVSGKRLFLYPNLMNRSTYTGEKSDDRKLEVVRTFTYTDSDTVIIKMPESLYPEFVPAPVKITNRFGEYEATYQFKEGAVTYIRRVKMFRGRFPKESYNELVDFLKAISKADNTKLVFLNKT